MCKQKGFSLIELLVVVAIILIIATIAIPSLIRSKAAAKQAGGAATVRTINTAQQTYNTSYGQFADTMAKLGPGGITCTSTTSAHACLLDSRIGCVTGPCLSDGYNYNIETISTGTPASVTAYTATAWPNSPVDGLVTYCLDSTDMVVRSDIGTGGTTAALASAACLALAPLAQS